MRFSTPRPFATLATSIALAGTLGLAGGAAALAQDATPAGTPIGPEASCFAPAMAAGPGGATAAASPVADATQPAATPVDDQAVIDEATAAIENLYACFNAGDGEAFVALYTAEGRLSALGAGDPAAIAAEIDAKSGMVQVSDITVHDVASTSDGSLQVDYQARVGLQLIHFTDTLVNQDGTWLVADRAVETPETELDSATASVKTSLAGGDVVIEVSPSPLMNQPAVKLQVTNGGDSAQNIVLFQGGDAASLADVDFSALPDDVTFVGEVRVQPGAISTTAFEELPEGNYVIVAVTDNGETGSFDLTIDPPFDPEA